MASYSIKELEQLSGIKAHTIRIWEKRHQLIQPKRSSTNIRYYSDDDLKKILNVSVLNSNGIKISKIAGLTTSEINDRVLKLSQSSQGEKAYVEQLVVAMIDLDEEQFDRLLLNFTDQFGFEATMLKIVYPFLEKIGVLWCTNNITPAQEHFVSNLIRQKIMAAIDALPFGSKTALKAVLFLPENEWHEIGLLFYAYIARKSGFKTYYLGQAVPYESLISVCRQHKPDLLITTLTVTGSRNVENYIQSLCLEFSKIPVLASGHALTKSEFKIPDTMQIFDNALTLKNILLTFKR